jgi:hypothetical protein
MEIKINLSELRHGRRQLEISFVTYDVPIGETLLIVDFIENALKFSKHDILNEFTGWIYKHYHHIPLSEISYLRKYYPFSDLELCSLNSGSVYYTCHLKITPLISIYLSSVHFEVKLIEDNTHQPIS